MTSPVSIRTQMLQRAARLLSATQSEEAWHLVGLFQQSQPIGFLHICHRILASFLELTHDYFDQDWPLATRLVRLPGTPGTLRHRRRRRNRTKTSCGSLTYWHEDSLDDDVDDIDLTSLRHSYVCVSPLRHHHHVIAPYCCASPASMDHSDAQTPKHTTGLGRLRSTLAAKRLFKQILPSRPRTPSATKLVCLDLTTPGPPMSISHKARLVQTVSATVHTRAPLAPIVPQAFAAGRGGSGAGSMKAAPDASCVQPRPSPSGLSSIDSSCCNTDSLICRCLIEYMLDTPAICSTEGLFRIPGNAQRIRELWISLRGFFQTPYIRLPQPDPELGQDSELLSTRWDLYGLLDAYPPHDLATLLLRCLTTCSQVGTDTSRSASPFTQSDETAGLDSTVPLGGLIPAQAGELCFLATRLQYGLEQPVGSGDHREDWMHMLCQARQLLTYRIVLQLLLPSPERAILFELLRLFKQVSLANVTSRMSAECLARCTAVAVFGPPARWTTSHDQPWSADNPLRWRIDTLTNLIRSADQLEQLPGVVYTAVRDRLRVRLGHSPVPRPQFTPSEVRHPGSTGSSSASSTSSMRYSRTYEYPIAEEPLTGTVQANTMVHERDEADRTVVRTHGDPGTCDSFVRHNPARISLHRAKSSLDSAVRHPGALGSSEAFKLWRHQKAGLSQSRQVLTKARSVSVFNPRADAQALVNGTK